MICELYIKTANETDERALNIDKSDLYINNYLSCNTKESLLSFQIYSFEIDIKMCYHNIIRRYVHAGYAVCFSSTSFGISLMFI